MSDAFQKLSAILDDGKHEKLIRDMQETTEKIARLVERVDYFNNHGTLPPPPTLPVEPPCLPHRDADTACTSESSDAH